MAKKTKTTTSSDAPKISITPGPARVDQGEIWDDLEIGNITTDSRNDRLAKDETIDELAISMRERGLLEPVVVGRLPGKQDGPFTLVAGHRRLEAAKRLGWQTIRAVVRDYSSDQDLQLDRAVENVHRLELNPLEEAFAVAGMIESTMDAAAQAQADDALDTGGLKSEEEIPVRQLAQTRKRAIEIVAGKLGKSVTWVTDRAFLSRLSGKARQLVLDGRLPLTHAREICKCADPDRRDALAQEFAAGTEIGSTPGSYDELRGRVGETLMSLAQVPWRLDVAFAGAPSCDACPANSANQPKLFEHHAPCDRGYHGPGTPFKEPVAGVCLNSKCFQEKAAVTNRQLAAKGKSLARRINDLPKADRPEVTAKKIAEAAPTLKVDVPKFLDPNKLVTRVKEEMTRRPTNKTSSGEPAKVKTKERSAADVAKEKAEDDLYEALQTRQAKLEKKIVDQLAKDPLARAALAIAQQSKLWHDLDGYLWSHRRDLKKAGDAASKPGMQQLINMLANPTLEGMRLAGAYVKCEHLLEYGYIHAQTYVVDRLAKAMGLDVPPRPTLEQFMPQPEGDKAAAEKPAKKAKGRKS